MNRATRAMDLRRTWRRRYRLALDAEMQARRKAEEGRDDAHEMVVELQRSSTLGAVAASTAHDFCNFLQVISASAEGIGRPDCDQTELAEAIALACDHSLKLVRQLATMAAPQPAESEILDLCAVVAAAHGPIKRLVARNVVLTIDNATPCLIRGDATELQQLILNLCINAGHALDGKRDGSLLVRVIEGEDMVRLFVRDNGCGIAAHHQPLVFEPFYTTRADGGGTGLGLSSAKLIAERAGGSIDLVSRVGHGTTVRVSLPRAIAHADRVSGVRVMGTG